jgi:tRNA G46 methylase TrmB
MDATWRRIYDELLISGFLGRINGLTERLAAGIGVVDVGCGSGHAVNVMAREFPRSRFVGYDLAEDAIANGRAITATIRPGATSPRSLSKRPRGSRWWI